MKSTMNDFCEALEILEVNDDSTKDHVAAAILSVAAAIRVHAEATDFLAREVEKAANQISVALDGICTSIGTDDSGGGLHAIAEAIRDYEVSPA